MRPVEQYTDEELGLLAIAILTATMIGIVLLLCGCVWVDRSHTHHRAVAPVADAGREPLPLRPHFLLPQPASRSEFRAPLLSRVEQVVGGCESAGRPDAPINWLAENHYSTASGGFQFLDSTWRSVTGLKPPASAYPPSVQIAAFVKASASGTVLSPWWSSRACWASAL